MSVTEEAYSSFDYAYTYFNEHLFGGELPDCLITFQRKGKSVGFYTPARFNNRHNAQKTDEISLNTDRFEGLGDIEILMWLVHQMCHHWHHHFIASKRQTYTGYHDRQWAAKMIRCGLMPTHTGQPKGRQTGSHVSQYILKERPFIWACQRLFADGFRLYWQSKEEQKFKSSKNIKKKKRDKVKYYCPVCQQNCWAKPNAKFDCGECRDRWGRVERMLPKSLDDDENEESALDLTDWTNEELNSLDLIPVSVPPVRQLKNGQ